MKTVKISLFLLVFAFRLQAGIIVLEGKYQNKNIYVQNAFGSSGVGFCTYEVTINGQTTVDEVNSTAFEIDFTPYQIKPGTEVLVRILHKDGCEPRVLNPDALRPNASFETTAININETGVLSWTTTNETGSLPFIIEQYRWNKWIKVGEVIGKGTPGINTYSFKAPAHSGENKFRVKQVGYGGQTKYSPQIKFISKLPDLTFIVSKDAGQMFLSGESWYEVYDAYGTVVKQGYGKTINIANLEKGIPYYFCFDNTTVEYKKK